MTKNNISIFMFIGCLFLLITCEEPKEDEIPPTVTITYPQSGSLVSEVIGITCISTDNEGVEKVELWIDGVSTSIIDETEPFELEWNTTSYENNSIHNITVRSYDKSGNKTDSELITLTVDNSNSYPQQINILSIDYTITEMVFIWEKSGDNDFAYYELLLSETIEGNKSIIVTTTDVSDTTYSIVEFDPLQPRWYWVRVTDIFGYTTLSNNVYILDSNPTKIELNIDSQDDSFIINWTTSSDLDFHSYALYESYSQDMTDEHVIYVSNIRNDFEYIITGISFEEQRFYRIVVSDYWGLQTSSLILSASSYLKVVFTKWTALNNRSEDVLHITDTAPIESIPEMLLNVRSSHPIWFPDGSRILFHYNNNEVASINYNGTGLLTYPDRGQVQRYNISPDGQLIVFYTNQYELFTVNVDGTNLIKIFDGSGVNQHHEMDISPDGLKLVYAKLDTFVVGEFNKNIYTSDIDGGNELLLSSEDWCFCPKWSPNGNKIAFVRLDSGLYTINPEGGDYFLVTDIVPRVGSILGCEYEWSPDGNTIIFANDSIIYIVDSNGNNIQQVSSGLDPDYFSDGSKILFNSNGNIKMMDIDGTNQVMIYSDGWFGNARIQPRQ